MDQCQEQMVKVECQHKGETQSDTYDWSQSVFTLQEKVQNEQKILDLDTGHRTLEIPILRCPRNLRGHPYACIGKNTMQNAIKEWEQTPKHMPPPGYPPIACY